MYPRLDMATSGWIYPVAPAHRVEGGYRVSGQWRFGSGSSMAGVPLGVAADALETAREVLAGKGDRVTGILYRDMPRVQIAISEATARLGSARSYVFSSLEKQWQRLESGEEPTDQERADVWLSRTNAFQAGRDLVRLMYDTIGGSAIYAKKSPFDRHLRDMETACQHVAGQIKGWEGVGSLLLGGPGGHALI